MKEKKFKQCKRLSGFITSRKNTMHFLLDRLLDDVGEVRVVKCDADGYHLITKNVGLIVTKR